MYTHGTAHVQRGALAAATRMDGLTRPESMWALQSENDKRPPHLLKALPCDDQLGLGSGCSASTPLASSCAHVFLDERMHCVLRDP